MLGVRTVAATRYVTPLREGGSLPAIIEADDDGMYVLKFRGAGQGPKALIAELVAGELARAAGLPVPEIVFVELDPDLARTEPDPEIQRFDPRERRAELGDRLPAGRGDVRSRGGAARRRSSRLPSSGSMRSSRTSTAPRAIPTADVASAALAHRSWRRALLSSCLGRRLYRAQPNAVPDDQGSRAAAFRHAARRRGSRGWPSELLQRRSGRSWHCCPTLG